MKRPLISSRLLLFQERRSASDAPATVAAVRRYRLARLRLAGPASPSAGRFEYLKRAHD